MKSVRTLTYALVILAAVHVLALTVTVPAMRFLLLHAGFGGFLPFAGATAAAITNDKTVLLGTVALVLLVAIPRPLRDLATALWPLGLGIVVGTLIGNGIRAAKEQDGEPVHHDDHHRP